MLSEHEQGRAYVRGMDASLADAAAGDKAAQARFVENATNYVRLLRDHIEKEDHCLFTMANQALTDSDQNRLLAAFSKVESEDMGHGTHEKYLRIADELADRYGVSRTTAVAPHAHCCGHH
jgi:hemerythrin-like domain-containing protein